MAKAKVVLGKRPEFLELTVKADVPEGEAVVKVQYAYRTHTEYGAMMDEVIGAGSAAKVKDDTVEAIATLTCEQRAAHILKIVKGWDLEFEFTKDSVTGLCNEYPGLALAIIQRYRDAIVDGRLGN